MSTDSQRTVTDYTAAESEAGPAPSGQDERRERPAWTPRGPADDDKETTIACEGCGRHVSRGLGRVMGDNQDRVHTCMQCGNNTGNGRTVAGLPPVETGGYL